jgi:WD40 repeat protein
VTLDRSNERQDWWHILAIHCFNIPVVVMLLVPRQGPPITALAIPPQEHRVLVGSQAGVFLAASETESQKVIETTLDHVHDFAFSPDGSVLAVAGGSPAEFGAVELWSWRDRTRIRMLEGHDDVIYAAQWLADAKTLITAAADRTLRVWDTTTGRTLATLVGHSGPVLCLAISPDGKLICSGSADQTIRVWDSGTWKPLRSLTNHLGPVNALTFISPTAGAGDPQLSYLASASGDGTVRIWQPEIGRMVRIVRQPSPVLTIAWRSQWLLHTGSKDGRVRRINGESGEVVTEEQLSAGWITSIAVERMGSDVWVGDSLGRLRLLRNSSQIESSDCLQAHLPRRTGGCGVNSPIPRQ